MKSRTQETVANSIRHYSKLAASYKENAKLYKANGSKEQQLDAEWKELFISGVIAELNQIKMVYECESHLGQTN